VGKVAIARIVEVSENKCREVKPQTLGVEIAPSKRSITVQILE
jgi:hypothetical protein